MTRPFDYFVIFAEMRTGSNFLESNLDQFPGLKTYGEAFNPYFMVRPKMKELFGVSVAQRNQNPIRLLDRMKEHSAGIPGFRFFHDHDERVFEHVIDDPRCAKVVLTRNLVDAYVSRKIAWETDQWQLNNVDDVVKQKARFVPQEFEKLFYRMKDFQLKILNRLQKNGQTAFYINYDDAQDLDVINGLARFLGETETISEFSGKFKKQNPEALEDKVRNYPDLVATIKKIDLFDLGRIPNFEPRRSPTVPSYVRAAAAPLLLLPVQGGPNARVRQWMADLDGVQPDDLPTGMTQKDLRKWKRDVPLPRTVQPGEDYDIAAHRAAFLAFLKFLKNNLSGQTTIRVDSSWASQGAILRAFSRVIMPDHVLRESTLEQGLSALCAEIGRKAPGLPDPQPERPFALADIHDKEIEHAARAVYQRDYMMFGFDDWAKGV